MKPFAIAMIVLMASGCVTSEKLRTQAPALALSSAKDARSVATCIAAAWDQGGALGMSMPIDFGILPDGYSVACRNQQVVQLMADVHRSGSGSVTRYYKVGWVAGVAKFETAVRQCQ